MPRTMTPAAATRAAARSVSAVLFVELLLDGGAVRANSSDRSITFSGNAFPGVGRLGRVAPVQEASELRPTGIQLVMSGIPLSHVSMVLDEEYQGRECSVWLGFLDAPKGEATDQPPYTYALIADPVLIFCGIVDQMGIELGDSATVTVTAESTLVRWERPNERRYTNDDQQKHWPGDKGLEFVPQTVEKEILWGKAPPLPPPVRYGGGGYPERDSP